MLADATAGFNEIRMVWFLVVERARFHIGAHTLVQFVITIREQLLNRINSTLSIHSESRKIECR
jgi:hypothetical protein